MATSVSATSKPPAKSKAVPAPRKKAASESKGGKPLQFRYYPVMKPHRVYPLIVEVPRGKREEADDGGIVVVRPIIAGALVVPAEQRLDTAAAGNQATFHVTPLSRGRLPGARVEVHVPGQPPQDVRLSMKAKTQRLSWFLLFLAFLLPWLVWRAVKEDWQTYDELRGTFQTLGKEKRPQAEDAFFADRGTLYAEKLTGSVQQDWVKTPFVTVPFEPEGEEKWEKFTLVKEAKEPLAVAYAGIAKGVIKNRWLTGFFALLLLSTFVSWSFHRPHAARVRRRLDLASAAEPATEPPTLQPL